MIGTGVFTSLGFQLQSVHNTYTIILLWLGGGLIAVCGAFAYAELGSHFKDTGGDYIFLSKVFHPTLGYLSAWAGLTIGFSAPIALASIAFIKYLGPVLPLNALAGKFVSITLILIITLMHSFTLRHSSKMQNISTAIKLFFLAGLIIAGATAVATQSHPFDFTTGWRSEITTTGFAVSMIFVTYSYTGWNAAAYIVDEIKDPLLNLPRALIFSTMIIIALYTSFQLVLLKHASIPQLEGRQEVSYISFNNLWDHGGGKWVSFFIAIQLIATISSYLWVGPRVTWAMSKNHVLWKPLSSLNTHGVPVKALWLHAGVSIILAATGSFEQILVYAGFILQLMSALTVATSLFVRTRPGEFRTPLKPLPQIIFLCFSVWVLSFTAIDKPLESLVGIIIVLSGILISKKSATP